MAKLAIIALFFLPFAIFVGWLAVGFVGVLRAEKRERESPTVFNPNHAYINWQARDGWPRGPFLSYQCAICGQALPSKSFEPKRCECGNLFVEAGRIGAKDETKVRLFEDRPENNPNPLSN